ncbi:MAG TPA: hypothetical protein DEP66_05410 [Acidimicrobiaceae bacterium]|nr:hypothetical protein [Acidimicrobiaceae bacterium]HCB37631.1 hypothetical protein [Acidimicrobiaceae bacterium]
MAVEQILGAANTGLLQAVLVAHIVCAVAGFGGALGVRSTSSASAGDGVPKRALVVTDVGLYGVAVFGVLAVLLDDSWKFSQTWVTLGFVLYIGWLALWHVVLRPGTGDRPRRRHFSQRLVTGCSAAADLLLVAAIVVMVVKPGL